MQSILQYVADVEQFAKLDKLVEAIEEVRVLVNKTEEFISKYYSRGELGVPVTSSFLSIEYNAYAVNTLKSVVSSAASDELAELKKRFELFKQEFDRGIAIQSAVTLESLLKALGNARPMHHKQRLGLTNLCSVNSR
jgi:hypothetical protein